MTDNAAKVRALQSLIDADAPKIERMAFSLIVNAPWQRIARLEPGLRSVRRFAVKRRKMARGKPNGADYRQCWAKVERLAGWNARVPQLRTSDAYNEALDEIARALGW